MVDIDFAIHDKLPARPVLPIIAPRLWVVDHSRPQTPLQSLSALGLGRDTMTLVPGPSKIHGAPLTLQPEYFTSSSFVVSLREDVSTLLSSYVLSYESNSNSSQSSPFALFKSIWKGSGWINIHLRVCEATGRVAFLATVARVFLGNSSSFLNRFRSGLIENYLEQACSNEALIMRIGALFGLYLFHFTQPETLYRQGHIPIPLGRLSLAVNTGVFR
jgi:hypothetical protein